MAFNGHLLSFNGSIFPNRYLTLSSYNITPNQRLEAEAYRDANGLTHRETLAAYKTKIEFSTKPNLKQSDKENMFAVFNNGLVNTRERKYNVTYWNFETDSYAIGTFYMPDVEYTIKKIETKLVGGQQQHILYYDPIRIAFIEY